MGSGNDPLGILTTTPKKTEQKDPLGILSKKKVFGEDTFGGGLLGGLVSGVKKIATTAEMAEEDDPLGNILQNKEREVAPLLYPDITTGKPTGIKHIDFISAQRDLDNTRSDVYSTFWGNREAATNFIKNELEKKGVAANNLQTIKENYNPKNLTQQLAVETLQDVEDIDRAVAETGSIEDAAEAYMAAKMKGTEGQQARFFSDLRNNPIPIFADKRETPDVIKGQWVDQFLHSPNVLAKAEHDAGFAQKVDEARQNLYKNFPKYGFKKVRGILSQERESRGMNSLLANNPSVESTEKLAKELLDSGKLSQQEYEVWDKEIKPLLGAAHSVGSGNMIIETPDFRSSISGGLKEGFEGIGRTIKRIGAISDPIRQNQLAREAMIKEYSSLGIQPSTEAGKVVNTAGHLTGYLMPMMLGGSVRSPQAVNNFLMFAGHNADAAATMFPNNSNKQLGYTALTTAADIFLGEFLPGGKYAREIKGGVTKDIAKIAKDFSTDKITAPQAKESFLNTVTNWAKKIPEKNLKTGTAVTGFGVVHNAADAAFGGRDLSFDDIVNEATEQGIINFFAATPLSMMHTSGRNKLNGDVIKSAIENPRTEEIIKQESNPEIIKNYETAKRAWEEIKDLDIKEEIKGDYLLKELQQKVFEEKAKTAATDVNKEKWEKAAQTAKIEKDAIYNPDKSVTDQLQEYYDNDLMPQGMNDMLSEKDKDGKLTDKFSPSKVGEFMKFIAQQANGLDAEWKPVGDKKPSMDGLEHIVELANERWKNKLEEAGIKETEGISEPIELSKEVPEDFILPEQMEQPTEVNIPKIKADEKPINAEVEKTNEPVIEPTKEEVITETTTDKVGEPPKGETEILAGEGEGNIGGITHAANEVRRKDRALPEYQKEPQTFESWNNEAEQKIKEGYDVEKLMDNIEKGHDPTPVENSIRKIYVATLDAEIAKNPTDELLAKQKRFIEIGDLANSRAGRNLVSLKGENSPLESISDFYVAKMEAAGVDKLTEQQKKETKEAFDNVQKADENATAAMEAYREEIAKLKAENELLKQKKEAKKPAKPKTKEEFVEQRKSLREKLKQQVEDFKAEGQKMGIASDGGLGSAIITAKMAKTIAEIAKSYIDEVGVNLKEVVRKTFEEVKDLIGGITEKDIHNVLAGEYREARPTRDELSAKMRDLKDEAFYINKLERLLAGTEPKSEKKKVARNRQITELQQKIKEFKKAEADAAKEPKVEIPDEVKKLAAIKKRNEKETEEIKEKIAKGEFDKEKKVPFLEDPEMQKKFPKEYKAALDAIVKKEEARHEFDIALMKDQMAKRSAAKKYIIDPVGDILGTTRALVTGIDASGIGIQNLVAMVAHPRSAAKALPASFGDFVSAKNQQRWLASVHNSKIFPLAQKAGLDITEPQSLKASEKEEIFTHNLLDKRIKFKGKTYVISKYITKPFERIFTGLGNRMRWNLWQRGVEKLQEEGYTWQSHPEEYKSLATVLNTETGRGKLHKEIDKAYNLISAGIWSPRLMASRLNILGLGDLGNLVAGGKKGYYGGLTPRMREYALKDLAKFVVFGGSLMALAGISFADDVDFDPRNPTFGSFLANGKRYNMWGGFTQYVRLATTMARGGMNIQGEFVPSNQLKTGLRFLWSKTTPAVGTGISMLNKDSKDYMGKPMTTDKALQNLLIPLSIRGITAGIEKEGAGSLFWTGLPSFIGMNVSYESDFEKKEQTSNRPERPEIERPDREK